MGTFQRSALLLCATTVAVTAGVVTFNGATLSRAAPALALAASPAEGCNSTDYSKHRLLPEPPVRDLTGFGKNVPGEIVMRVVRNGSHYCYILKDDARGYVDAPTIRVRKDQIWTLRLVDEIAPTPAPSTSPSGEHAMPMPGATKSPDGCDILDFDDPLPAPSDAGYLGKRRIFAKTPQMPSTDTNLHTHGFHVNPDVDNVFKRLSNDGSPHGTRECVYKFQFFKSQYVGTYWYHSHMHGIAQAQVGGGLAGTIIVDPPVRKPRLDEHVLLIKDYQAPVISETNQVLQSQLSAAQGNPGRSTVPQAVPSFYPQHPPSWLSGQPIVTSERCPTAGRLVHWVVNGYPLSDPQIVLPNPPAGLPPPLAPPLSIVAPAHKVLYRAVNATSESFVNLRLLNASGEVEKLAIVGRDGVPVNGSDENAEALEAQFDNVLLPPGGRADVVITGQTRPQLLIADMVCTGYLGDWIPRRNIVEISPTANVPDPSATATPSARLMGAAPTGAVSMQVARRGQTDADKFLSLHPTPAKKRVFTFTQYDACCGAFGAFYLFETTDGAKSFSEQPFWLSKPPASGRLPHEHFLPNVVAHTGTTEDWTLINATAEVHAFHIHQLTFVTEYNPLEGGPVHVRQDVVAIPSAIMDPAKAQNGNFPWLKPERVVIHMDFTKAQKGVYVYHCHMLFHEDRGMMGIIQVI